MFVTELLILSNELKYQFMVDGWKVQSIKSQWNVLYEY